MSHSTSIRIETDFGVVTLALNHATSICVWITMSTEADPITVKGKQYLGMIRLERPKDGSGEFTVAASNGFDVTTLHANRPPPPTVEKLIRERVTHAVNQWARQNSHALFVAQVDYVRRQREVLDDRIREANAEIARLQLGVTQLRAAREAL